MKKAFKKASGVFDYAREVKQVWRDFPRIKDKVYFFDLCLKSLIYPCSGVRRKWKEMTLKYKHGWLPKQLDASAAEKCSLASSLGDHKVVFLWTKKETDGILPVATQGIVFGLDHELGHVIIPGGSSGGKSDLALCNRSECIADAYATIRHLQRYGADSLTINALSARRAHDSLFYEDHDDYKHFTSPVVEQILARRYEVNWNNLTPHETTKLARRFALSYAMPPERFNVMWNSFKNVRAENTMEAVAEAVLSAKSPDVFKYGAIFLNTWFAGQLSKKIVSAPFDAEDEADEYWQDVSRQLAKKKKTFAAQDNLLFDRGAKDRLLQSNVVKFKPR